MARFLIVLGVETSEPYARLAEGSLRSIAARTGHWVRVERTRTDTVIADLRADPGEYVLLADCDERIEVHFACHPHRTCLTVSRLILETEKLLLELPDAVVPGSSPEVPKDIPPLGHV